MSETRFVDIGTLLLRAVPPIGKKALCAQYFNCSCSVSISRAPYSSQSLNSRKDIPHSRKGPCCSSRCQSKCKSFAIERGEKHTRCADLSIFLRGRAQGIEEHDIAPRLRR